MRKFAVFSAILLAVFATPNFVLGQDAGAGIDGGSFRGLQSGLSGIKSGVVVGPIHGNTTPVFETIDEDEYLVGPGDQFQIIYGGQSLLEAVNSEGDLVVGAAPPIRLDGETLSKARLLIRSQFSKYYKGDQIYVTLSRAKSFQVSLTGEFVRPGFHVMQSGARVSDAIASAQGFAYRASRSLTLITAKGIKREIDLSGYFTGGDRNQNPLLNQGDQLIAPAVDFSADVLQVRDSESVRAMSIMPNDNLETLLHRFNNYNAAKEWHFVRVFKDGVLQETISRSEGAKYVPRPGVLLEIHTPLTKVFVGGTVVSPGEMQYDPRMNLADYVARSGITVNTSRNYKGAVIVSADGKTRNARSAVEPIFPGDHIWVPRSLEAQTRDYLVLITAVSSFAVAVATLFVLTGTQ